MQRLTISARMYCLIALSLAILAGALTFSLFQSYSSMERERKAGLAYMNDIAMSMLKQYHAMEISGEMNREQQRSVVMVLHDLNMAARYCDYLIVMKDGEIVSSGTPRAVITPDLLRDVFKIEGAVLRDPQTGAPVVIPERSYSPPVVPDQTAVLV